MSDQTPIPPCQENSNNTAFLDLDLTRSAVAGDAAKPPTPPPESGSSRTGACADIETVRQILKSPPEMQEQVMRDAKEIVSCHCIPGKLGIACLAGDVAELESELAATTAERNELRMGCPPTYEAALDKARGQLHRLRHVLLQRLHECGDFAEFDGTNRICNVCQQEIPEDMETQLAAAQSALATAQRERDAMEEERDRAR